MKKATLLLSIFSFALTLAAAPHPASDEKSNRLGRRENDPPAASVPDANSTLALATIGVAALGVGALAAKRKGNNSAPAR